MKKIIQSYSTNLKPLVLDFSDIEKVFNILLEECKEVKLTTKTIEFENLEELKNLSEDIISNLEIQCSSPYVHIEFKKNAPATIYIAEDTPLSRGILAKVKELLEEKQLKSYSVVSIFEKILKKLFCLSLLVLFCLVFFNVIQLKFFFVSILLASSLFVVLGLPSSIYTSYIETHYIQIFLHGKKVSFWKRKKDEIKLSVISGIISFIGGYFVAILTK